MDRMYNPLWTVQYSLENFSWCVIPRKEKNSELFHNLNKFTRSPVTLLLRHSGTGAISVHTQVLTHLHLCRNIEITKTLQWLEMLPLA